MLTKALDWIIGREPVATGTGIAALVTAALGVAAAFGVGITTAQIAAIGALAAALAGMFARAQVTPVTTPALRALDRAASSPPPDSRGSIPLALVILVALAVVVMSGLAFCGDALFEDEDEVNDVGIELVSHEYECMDHDYCGGGGYEDDRDGGKQTCFMACYIVVPNPFDPGGGRDPEQPRTAHA